jgi:hypothetical protein
MSALTSGRQNFIKNFHLFAGQRGTRQVEDPSGKTIFNEIVTKTLDTAKNVRVPANVTLPWENDEGLLYNSEGEKLLFRINYLRYNLSLVPYEKGHAPETEKEREEEDAFFTEWGFKKPMENPFASRTIDPYYIPTAEASQAMWNELIKCELAYAEMQAEIDYRKSLVHWILGEAPGWQYGVCDWVHNKEDPSKEEKEKMKHSHMSLTRGIVQAEEVENGMKAFFMKYLLGKMPENDEEAHLYYKYGVLGKPVYFKYILDEIPSDHPPRPPPSSRVPGMWSRATSILDAAGFKPELGPLDTGAGGGETTVVAPPSGGDGGGGGGAVVSDVTELDEAAEDIPGIADAALVDEWKRLNAKMEMLKARGFRTEEDVDRFYDELEASSADYPHAWEHMVTNASPGAGEAIERARRRRLESRVDMEKLKVEEERRQISQGLGAAIRQRRSDEAHKSAHPESTSPAASSGWFSWLPTWSSGSTTAPQAAVPVTNTAELAEAERNRVKTEGQQAAYEAQRADLLAPATPVAAPAAVASNVASVPPAAVVTDPSIIRGETILQRRADSVRVPPERANTLIESGLATHAQAFPDNTVTPSPSLFPNLAALKTEIDAKNATSSTPSSSSTPQPPASTPSSSPTTPPEDRGLGVGAMDTPPRLETYNRRIGNREHWNARAAAPSDTWTADEIADWGLANNLIKMEDRPRVLSLLKQGTRRGKSLTTGRENVINWLTQMKAAGRTVSDEEN